MYYVEQSGKGFKAKLKVCEKELEKYLESWNPDEDLLGTFYGTENEYVIWCLRYVAGKSHKIMRCYDKEDDETNLRSYSTEMIYWT